MDEKPTSPQTHSESVLNVEMPEGLEPVSPESNTSLTGDPSITDHSNTRLNNENTTKIGCTNTIEKSLTEKQNEIVHNSNHTEDFQPGHVDNIDSESGKISHKSNFIDRIHMCNESVSEGSIDLDANDNNTSAAQGEPTSMELTVNSSDETHTQSQRSETEDYNMELADDMSNEMSSSMKVASEELVSNKIMKVDENSTAAEKSTVGIETSSGEVESSMEAENETLEVLNESIEVVEQSKGIISESTVNEKGSTDVKSDNSHEMNDNLEVVNMENELESIDTDKNTLHEQKCTISCEVEDVSKVGSESIEQPTTKINSENQISDVENECTHERQSTIIEKEKELTQDREIVEVNREVDNVNKDIEKEKEVENECMEVENENMEVDKDKTEVRKQTIDVSKGNATVGKHSVDSAEKKDEDCDASPDFECSDIKEHMPSDEKQEVADKSHNDEVTENEEDPFDQVMNETMDIEDVANKESSTNKHADFRSKEVETPISKDLDNVNEESEEIQDVDASKGADEEVCLLPDTEREITEADKERAILAKEILAKEAANKGTKEAPSVFDSLTDGEKLSENESSAKDVEMLSQDKEVASGKLPEENNMDQITIDEQIDISQKECDDKDTENELIDTVEADTDISEPLKENVIQEMTSSEQSCLQCSQIKQCKFQILLEGTIKYLCQKDCVLKCQADNENYTINVKKVIIKEVVSSEQTCLQCLKMKFCQYEIVKESGFLCNDECVKVYKEQVFGKFVMRYKKVFVQETMLSEKLCSSCNNTKEVRYQYNTNGDDYYICSEDCLSKLQEDYPDKYRVKVRKLFRVKEMPRLLSVVAKDIAESPKITARSEEAAELARLDREKSFSRNCTMCEVIISGDEKNLSWETMDFCNEDCLSKYQNVAHANCSNCKIRVQTTSLGKYCVRFGYDIRQFCSSGCLEEFKKGLKVCSYCQKDISGGFEGFLAPVGDKGQFKDFCTQACMEKFDQMSKNSQPPNVVNQCAVCNKDKVVKVNVVIDGNDHKMCSNPCFSAFKFVNKLFPDQCDMCKKYYERKSSAHFTIYEESVARTFCSKTCMNVFILSNRHIVPCNWCKVKKYNFDMIRRNLNNGQKIMMCSLNCLTLYQVSVNAVSMRRIKCDHCKSLSQAQYHLTMSDATIRNFCTYQCVMAFQGQYSKSPITLGTEQHKTPPVAVKGAPVPTGVPKRTHHNITRQGKAAAKSSLSNKSFDTPIISNVHSLAPSMNVHLTRSAKANQKSHPVQVQPTPSPAPAPPPPPPKPQFKTQLIVKPPCPKLVANMSTMCKPITLSKGTSCRTQTCVKECQTDDSLQKRILIPIPVPIYVPTPLNMFSLPYPVPVPIPMPIPVPIFIPTTRNSANGIMKEIKKIHEKMPTDPFEAELLMMAEMVAGDKKRNESDSDSEEEPADDEGFSPEGMESSNTFGEDMLQMALKMATEYDEPAVDLESAMTANTITPSSHPPMSSEEGVDDPNPMHHHHMLMMEQQRAAIRGRKRPSRPQSNSLGGSANKRNRRVSNTDGLPMMQPPAQPDPPREPTEKPDANMCLKYTFGVNAWKQWVMTKNADIEKSTIRRKPFKSEILQLTADELNYSLCLFVKEVRKPNGSEYAPDTIYYLVLGIQQYLFENGRIDNIFTDAYYEKFTECLDEVAKKFSVLYNDSQYIVTRVEEEHLWESKQLGAHSPHVLLSTLMFFNTKHFNLVTVEEHMQLSFSHIMKHWKRNPNQPGATKVPGSRNVLLRFYPPQAALEANSRKKKVYEQQENEENPLRCPVKLYEFYLSKCPESVKTRNDVFYLLPERSCVPDSPVWYSTMALGKEPLQKMLHRVKMVKEINIALLTS